MVEKEAPDFSSSHNSLTTYTLFNSSERNPEASFTQRANKRIAMLNWVEKTYLYILRHTCTTNSTPSTSPYLQKGDPNSQLLTKEWRVWTTHIVLQLLQLPPEKSASKSLSFGSKQGSEFMSIIALQWTEAVLTIPFIRYPLQVPCSVSRQKCPTPSFSWKRSYCILS